MKKFLMLVAALLALAMSAGCSTIADAKAAKGTGTVRVYDQPYDAVWSAAENAVKGAGLALVSENKDTGEILAQGAMSMFSYGENVAVYVERVNGKISTRVEIISKRALATNITATNWETRLTEAMDAQLKKS